MKILRFMCGLIIFYPSSSSLGYFWNLGSLLAFILVFQITSGLFLVFYYIPSCSSSFSVVDFLTRELWFGFPSRSFHLCGASLFFLCLFLHLLKGFLWGSYRLSGPWLSGVTIFLFTMGTAFLGYVLPWGQISLWGASVITNLVSTVPVWGSSLVLWVWGGYSINECTLTFFFSLHFLLPFVILLLVVFHLFILHETSSTNSLGVFESFSKVSFYPYFILNDLFNIFPISLFFGFILFSPWSLGDPENWIPANSGVTPVHIQPEWYFLFAYCILRGVPNNLGGVVIFSVSVLILYLFPFFPSPYPNPRWLIFLLLSLLGVSFLLLTWLGSCPVESPFIALGRFFSLLYFLSIFVFLAL